MRRIFLISFLFIIVVRAGAQYPRVEIPGSEVRKLTSSIVKGQEYELQILLPGGYSGSNKKYPVVYLMDSQWDFPLVKSIYGQQYFDGFIPELIIVGVTWGGTKPNPDSLRVRDYTPTNAKERPQSGGAENFLSFIQKELFPFIEKNYRAESSNRTLMGLSFGGLFTLYTLFTHPEMFSGYVAASPAIGWDREVIYKYEKQYFERKSNSAARLYLTIGDVERGLSGFNALTTIMRSREYPNLQFSSSALVNTGHSGTKSETFSRGLQYVFERPKLSLDAATLNSFAGTYSSSIGEKITIMNQGSQLVLYFSPTNSYKLYASGAKDFYSPAEFLNLHFEKESLQINRYGSSWNFKKSEIVSTGKQEDSITSQVYRWKDLIAVQEETRVRRAILEGKTLMFDQFEIHATTLQPGMAPHAPHKHADQEELIIVKEGSLRVDIETRNKLLDPAGIAMAIPGEMHGFQNAGNTPVTYYVIKYRSRVPMNLERGRQAGGSMLISRDELKFQAHDKGGRVDYFDRATSQLEKFEMHTTTLNAGLQNHATHTHVLEEIILILKGDVEVQIGDEVYKATAGDLVFLSSNVPHSLKNTGNEQCEYFAFQWRN